MCVFFWSVASWVGYVVYFSQLASGLVSQNNWFERLTLWPVSPLVVGCEHVHCALLSIAEERKAWEHLPEFQAGVFFLQRLVSTRVAVDEVEVAKSKSPRHFLNWVLELEQAQAGFGHKARGEATAGREL